MEQFKHLSPLVRISLSATHKGTQHTKTFPKASASRCRLQPQTGKQVTPVFEQLHSTNSSLKETSQSTPKRCWGTQAFLPSHFVWAQECVKGRKSLMLCMISLTFHPLFARMKNTCARKCLTEFTLLDVLQTIFRCHDADVIYSVSQDVQRLSCVGVADSKLLRKKSL